MKKIIVVLFTTLCFAQNPDKGISIHFTPTMFGAKEVFTEGYTKATPTKAETNFKDRFGYSVLVKIPAGDNFTLSPFYNESRYEGSSLYSYKDKPIGYERNINQRFHSYGVTFSIYFGSK